MTDRGLRDQLVDHARRMIAAGLVRGTSGNLSARTEEREAFLITPSGVDYETMRAEDIVLVALDGTAAAHPLKPSVDTPIHAAIYRVRADVGACVHTHSTYATAFSVVRRDVPAYSVETGGFLGGAVRVIGYVPPSRPDTGDAVAAGLAGSRGVLLPNHGVMAVGETLAKAFAAAVAIEESAHLAFIALQLGQAAAVPDDEITRINDFIHHHYGQV